MAVRNGVPDEVLGELYPFEDKYVVLDDGRSMHYIEMGKRGPTILLLHGNPTWSLLYRKFMEPLSKNARVIAVDHVGFGRSDHPELEYYCLEKHIQNLEEFVNKLGLRRVIPVVQDWGGPIGLGWATRHPEKVAGLVVLNTWAFTSVPPKLPWWFRFMASKGIGDIVHRRMNAFVEKIIPAASATPIPEHVMNGYRHPFPDRASRAGILAFPRMIPTHPGHRDWATMTAIEQGLPKLDVPAIIAWGVLDPAFGKRYAHMFHDALPQARAPQWVKAGHYVQEDAPDEIIPLIVELSQKV